MSIHRPKKKKIIKASSGINTDQVLGVAQAGAGMIPGVGQVASLGIGIARTLINNHKQKKAEEKAADRARNIALNDSQRESNRLFGTLTYEDGGEIPGDAPMLPGEEGKAVVLDGKSHKDGGNDVIDSETGEKVAETESQELIFTDSQTQQIEGLIAEYDSKQDQECLLKLGKLVKSIVEKDMVDYSGKFS